MGKKNSKSEWTFNIDINPSVSLKKKKSSFMFRRWIKTLWIWNDI